QRRALTLADLPSEEILDQLLEWSATSVRRSDAPLINATEHTKALGYVNFRRADLIRLMEEIRNIKAVESAPSRFYQASAKQVQEGTLVAYKAADQLPNLAKLRAIAPATTALIIIRDGRDAAVSAGHYEALMREQEAPWQVARTSMSRRLLGWAVRAAKLAQHAQAGDVLIIRYEDFKANFPGICRALFNKLGLDASIEVIEKIEQQTDFKRVNSQLPPNEESPHVTRRGIVGEWQEALTPNQARRMWSLAAAQLRVFGYGKKGDILPSSLVLQPEH
ncbi:MAG: sulfotransferase domain-containing protein, partial [Pseudomonadota bacterium]